MSRATRTTGMPYYSAASWLNIATFAASEADKRYRKVEKPETETPDRATVGASVRRLFSWA